MSSCDVQNLLDDGKCFSSNCLTLDQQVVAELELLSEIAAYTGTVQELITAGHCFNVNNIGVDGQVIAELQLYCEILNA